MVVYKMTSRNGKSLYAGGKLGRRYEVGEEVEANPEALERGYGLLVFGSLRSCSAFAPGWGSFYRVFRVEVKEKDRMKGMGEALRLSDLTGIRKFIAALTGKKPRLFGRDWPGGTRMYRKLRVVEEVK